MYYSFLLIISQYFLEYNCFIFREFRSFFIGVLGVAPQVCVPCICRRDACTQIPWNLSISVRRYDAGADMLTAPKYLGHSDVQTTMRISITRICPPRKEQKSVEVWNEYVTRI